MTKSTANVVEVSHDDRGVARVSLNRPAVNNAYNAELVSALAETFAELAMNEDLRVVLISGNGPNFQAGADLKWLREIGKMAPDENIATSLRTASLVRDLDAFPIPTIALIHGACIGGGTGIACACDIVLASEDAFFSISEARWGAIASIIFPQLNAAIGVRNVRRFALTCERFDAHKAKDIGLVHEVVPCGALEAKAALIVDNILQNGPMAMKASKHWAKHAGESLNDELFKQLVKVHAETRQTQEALEGFTSFIEKRDASWYRNE
ncbi:MAG: enoyl-CoA hydratase-related protein [Pseudomonadota bacterium]